MHTLPSKDTIGEQVIIKSRSLTSLHQRMDWMMRTTVRTKDPLICVRTPTSRELLVTLLQIKRVVGSKY